MKKTKLFLIAFLVLILFPLGIFAQQKQQGPQRQTEETTVIEAEFEFEGEVEDLNEETRSRQNQQIHEPGTGLNDSATNVLEQKQQEQKEQESEPVLDSELIPDLIMVPEPELELELGEQQPQQEKALDTAKGAQEQKGKELLNEKSLQRRSEVANAVQKMLQVAERNEGVGDQIRQVAQVQNQIQEEAEQALSMVQERKGVVKFLIGPNYSQLKKAEEKLKEQSEKVQELESLKEQLESPEDSIVLDEKITTINQVVEKGQEEIKQQKRGFSLFGWFSKIFVK